MRAKGKSNGEILSWLHTQGVSSTLAEIAAFWQHHAAQQQARHQHQSQEPQNQPQPPPSPAPPRPGAQDRPCGVAPVSPEWLVESAKNTRQLTEWFRDNPAPDLALLMNLYKNFVMNLMLKGDVSPESLKQLQQMMRTVTSYEQGQTRLAQRERALKLKEADHEQKAQKAATAAENPAKTEHGAAKDIPKDFDNTEFIKVMREEYFKDAYTPEMTALVQKKLMEADAQALAAGIKFVPYVPPGPPPPKPPVDES